MYSMLAKYFIFMNNILLQFVYSLLPLNWLKTQNVVWG